MKVFVQAWRMIRSYRLYSVINMLGLALGLACTIFWLATFIARAPWMGSTTIAMPW